MRIQAVMSVLLPVCVLALGIVGIFAATVFVEEHNEKKKRGAFAYLINRTRGFYFYGYPLSDVLRVGLASELRERGIGDFEKELALLTMAALTVNSDYEDTDTTAVVLATRIFGEGGLPHNEAAVCFRDRQGWWICELNGGIMFRALEPVGRKYKNFEWLMVQKPLSCKELSDKQAEALLMCKVPEMSKLQPASFYSGNNMMETQAEVDRMMEIHYANREKFEVLD